MKLLIIPLLSIISLVECFSFTNMLSRNSDVACEISAQKLAPDHTNTVKAGNEILILAKCLPGYYAAISQVFAKVKTSKILNREIPIPNAKSRSANGANGMIFNIPQLDSSDKSMVWCLKYIPTANGPKSSGFFSKLIPESRIDCAPNTFYVDDSPPSSFSSQQQVSSQFSSVQAAQNQNILVHAVTWNVNGQNPPDDLSDLLLPLEKNRPEVYAFGLQEIIKLKPANSPIASVTSKLVKDNAVTQWIKNKLGNEEQTMQNNDAPTSETKMKLALWRDKIAAALSRKGQYELIGQKVGFSVGMLIFARQDVRPYISKASFGRRSTDMLMQGSKGALAFRFDYYDTSVCIVSAHFAAHQDKASERIDNYENLRKGIRFGMKERIEDHDHVVWMGDLNFRVQLPLPSVMNLIKTGSIQTLGQSDELIQKRQEGLVFKGYQEASITFSPTYKFVVGSNFYDTSRIPSWTDRILVRGTGSNIYGYSSCSSYTISDHRAVRAVIRLPVAWKYSIPSHAPTRVQSPVNSETDIRVTHQSDSDADSGVASSGSSQSSVTGPAGVNGGFPDFPGFQTANAYFSNRNR